MTGLTGHLARYGISQFGSRDYWEWAGNRLGPTLASRADKLREPIAEDRAKKSQALAFYDFIADPKVASVVHSMKADAIRASGEFIAKRIDGRRRILDLGCSIGYLTTWYGMVKEQREVLGIDVSRKSIEQARELAADLGVGNVSFEEADITSSIPGGNYDAVTDAQTLSDTEDIEEAIKNVREAMDGNGILVSVSALPEADDAREFLERLNAQGFRIESFDWIYSQDLGETHAYLGLLARLHGQKLRIDLTKEYDKVLRRLG